LDGYTYAPSSWLYFRAAHPDKQEALEDISAGLCRLMTDISLKKFGVPIVVRCELLD